MGREGWEDGTPPPHRDVKERCVVRWPSPTLGSLPLSISLRSLSPLLAATFMPPRGRPTLVVLSLVISSSVASFSSASSCAAAACRSLFLAASFAFRRSSVLLAAYPGPSSLSSSPRARTIFLTPTPIICLQVMLLLRSTLSSDTCTSTDDAGAGVPFGCVVTSDNWISTGSSSSESSSPASFRSALRLVRSVWLTLHAVNRRFIHPIIFSRSSEKALVLSLFRTHVCMAIEAAFPTTCSSLVSRHLSCELPSLSFGVRECGQRAGNHGRYFVALPLRRALRI